MSIQTTLKVDTDILDAISDAARKAPKLTETAMKRAIRRRKSKILKRLRVVPGKPRYPLRWKSERQRRAFFATRGFGRGIPTRRTGQLQRGWDVNIDTRKDFGRIEIGNDVPYAVFVEGDFQQPFHIDTGYPFAPTIIVDEIETLNDVLIETWFTVVDPA